ncbi:MAG: HlyC/CorC family transporter [Deltaproteobacteria bacterium]|nr:HlyC/CorC family transporter [Deltaproteobacteria bacterium]
MDIPLSPGGFSSFHLFLAVLCIFFNAFFVASEFAMVKIRSTRLETLYSQGNIFARWATPVVENLNEYLSATQLGITLASLGLGWLGEPAFAILLEPLFSFLPISQNTLHTISFACAFTLISFLHLVVGELVPKQMAIQMAEKILLITAPLLRAFYVLFYPALKLLNFFTKLIMKALGFNLEYEEACHDEEEIRLIVENSYEDGSLSQRKASLLENVFEFSHSTVKHIMVPKQDIVFLSIYSSSKENLDIAKESGHTRFPLCDKDLEQVLGLVNVKDIIWHLEDEHNLINIFDLKRPILFVPEGKPIDQLLREFQTKKIHMAMVIDEFGMTVGLVTLEDVLEVIVGEIQDEFDQEAPKILKISEDEYRIDGTTPIPEVSQALNIILHDENNVSIAGYIINCLGRLAKEGDQLELQGFSVRVEEVKRRRILKLHFSKIQSEENASPGTEEEIEKQVRNPV